MRAPRNVRDRRIERLRVGDRLADAHVDHDLVELRNLVHVGVLKAFLQLRADGAFVLLT
jgi:hypothetical protein